MSLDALVETRMPGSTHYRHDYSPENSAKLRVVMNQEADRRGFKTITAPCISTLRGRLRSRMVVAAHDGVCVQRFAEVQWYVILGYERKAKLASPPHEPCP